MQDFRKLEIYKRSTQHCVDIYRFSLRLPLHEKFGLISQIRRAAHSVPLNISEGAGSRSNNEFAQFISYAYRSVNEVLTCLELIERLELCSDIDAIEKLRSASIELSRMLYAFFKKLGGRDLIS